MTLAEEYKSKSILLETLKKELDVINKDILEEATNICDMYRDLVKGIIVEKK